MLSWERLISAMLVSCSIAVLSILLAIFLLRPGRQETEIPGVPALVSCTLVGLLSGLSLLVLLPSAIDGLVPVGYSAFTVMLAFAGGPVLMHFVYNVVLDGHQCPAHGGGSGFEGSIGEDDAAMLKFTKSPAQDGTNAELGMSTPDKSLRSRRRKPAAPNHWCNETCCEADCEDADCDIAPKAVAPAAEVDSRPISLGALCVRVGAWMAHATLEGWMLGSAHTVPLLLTLALPVLLCSLQDTASLVIGETARMASYLDADRLAAAATMRLRILVAAILFALSFPLGASAALFLSRYTESPNTRSGAATLLYLRALTAGLFLYMALFDFAPRHRPHGRKQAFKWLCAFLLGLCLACLAEAFEDIAAAMATPSSPGEPPPSSAASAVASVAAATVAPGLSAAAAAAAAAAATAAVSTSAERAGASAWPRAPRDLRAKPSKDIQDGRHPADGASWWLATPLDPPRRTFGGSRTDGSRAVGSSLRWRSTATPAALNP